MSRLWQRMSRETHAILSGLRERVRTLGEGREDRITEKAGDYWISWRSERGGRVFAELRPSRKHVEIFLLPPRWELRGADGLARAAPVTQGWGWFRTRMLLTSVAQVPRAFELVRQSYEHGRRKSFGGLRRQPNGRRERIV